MYGLPQAGRLANDQLIALLAPHGYHPVPLSRPDYGGTTLGDIVFSLVVDDFGVRYTSGADTEHLITTLETAYEVSTNWTGARYYGLTLKGDYNAHTCDASMPGYIDRAPLPFFNIPHHPNPNIPPTRGSDPIMAQKHNMPPLPDNTIALDAADKLRILEVLGALLFYARASDSHAPYGPSVNLPLNNLQAPAQPWKNWPSS